MFFKRTKNVFFEKREIECQNINNKQLIEIVFEMENQFINNVDNKNYSL